MKNIISLIFLIITLSARTAAQYSIDWVRPGTDYQKTGVMNARDKQDNLVVTGYWTANNIYTRKYDKFGNLQWEKTSSSGVPGNYEKSVWVNCDSSNNVIVTGYRYSLGTYHYPNALVALKYDAAGNLVWKNTIPMTFFVNHLIAFNMRSEIDNAGNIYIGTVATSPAGFVLLKIDASGNTLFTQSDNTNPVAVFLSMRLKGSHVIMSGSTPVTTNANAICWTTAGAITWNSLLTGRGGIDIEMDETGNTYLLSSLENQVSPGSQSDILIYQINSSGIQTAVNPYDFGGNDFPTRFIYSGGKFSTVGTSSVSAGYFDWITFQVNAAGVKLWDARYNETTINDEIPYGLTAKSNGEVFVTGRGGPNHTIIGTNYLRMITLKYSNTGIRIWVDSVHVYNGWGRAISLAADNSLYAVSDGYTTAFHFLDHDGSTPASIPLSVNAINVGSSTATITWSSVPGAYLYHIRYKKSSDMAWTVQSTANTSHSLTGLTENTQYDYGCEAINNGGPSGYSATQSFTTGSVLPVTGLVLNAQRQGRGVSLYWTTQTEINTSYFDVQRSLDGVLYSSIGSVTANGNSSSPISYQYFDATASAKKNFYRLKIVDRDNLFTYSTISFVSGNGNQKKIYLYPNPARKEVNMLFTERQEVGLKLKLLNQHGQLLREIIAREGVSRIDIDISDLPKGLYYVMAVTADKIKSCEKLLVQ